MRRKQRGEAAGGEQLGCSLYELPPGGRGERTRHAYYATEDAVDYWDGE